MRVRKQMNQDVREYASASGVYLYEIAAALNLDAANFSRKLHFELPDDEKQKLMKIIDSIAEKEN